RGPPEGLVGRGQSNSHVGRYHGHDDGRDEKAHNPSVFSHHSPPTGRAATVHRADRSCNLQEVAGGPRLCSLPLLGTVPARLRMRGSVPPISERFSPWNFLSLVWKIRRTM